MEIKIQRLPHAKDLPLPEYKTAGSVGFDLHAATKLDWVHCIKPMESLAVPTGIAVAIPDGYELQIRPRSGLAARSNISIVNSPGTIDSDFRGEIIVLLINHDKESFFMVNRGDRIAQAVVSPIVQVKFLEVDELPETIRGVNGFGSTGV